VDFLVVAGPCVIESVELCLEIAGQVKALCGKLGVPYVFKASFDKANRSSAGSYRGMGLEEGLGVLSEVGKRAGVPVTTDVHESEQSAAVGAAVDMLQIPAFLCRQTDLLVAAAKTGKAVNVKKGQFMAPWEMGNAVEKVKKAGNDKVILTERGTFFGYNRLVNDMTGIPQMQGLGGGTPVLMDATHSTQLPGGLGTATGGQREYVPLLARAATASGVDGLFIEVHPEPAKSPSDAATILALKDLPGVLEECLAIRAIVRRG
jgi:2-dehydro-3-deoxyphosphooctonate aldolase (KDO 8-P synthase)